MALQKIKDGALMGIWLVWVVAISWMTYAAYNALTGDKVSGNTLIATEWNQLVDNQIAIKAQVDGISASSIPSGAIMMFKSACPTGWSEDSSFRDKVARWESTGNAGDIWTGGSDDAVVVSHTHTASSASAGSHSHTYQKLICTDSPKEITIDGTDGNCSYTHSFATSTSWVHTHWITVNTNGSSWTNANIPSYQEVIFCVKD